MKSLKIKKWIALTIILTLLITLSFNGVSALTTNDFEYTVENGAARVTKYTGDSESVIVPSKIDGYEVKSIAMDAFSEDNCKAVKSVVVSEGIETVENWLFTSCINIESITLPSTIDVLATDWFFIGGTKLKELKISGENPRYYTDKGVLYDSKKKHLMLCPAQNKFVDGEYKILDETTDIRGWAFTNCANLNKIVMPDTVTSIGDHAFSSCCNLSELVLSKSIKSMSYNAFGSLSSLKEITIPKNVTGFYYNGNNTYTYLGYNGTEKIENFTIKGYKNSEAEKYANDNGFKFIALDEQIDYYLFNPIEFIGKLFDEITGLFGSDYVEIEEPESGSTKFIGYPNTANPFEFGFDYKTNRVIAVYVYDLSDTPVKLFDDITNKSLISDIENSNTSYTYTRSHDYLADSEIVYFSLENNITVTFEWVNNDLTQSADRVLIFQKESDNEVVEDTTTTVQESTQEETTAVTIPTSSIDSTSNIFDTNIATSDTATKDSINSDNGTIQTGVVFSIVAIVVVMLTALGIGVFAWQRRKIFM